MSVVITYEVQLNDGEDEHFKPINPRRVKAILGPFDAARLVLEDKDIFLEVLIEGGAYQLAFAEGMVWHILPAPSSERNPRPVMCTGIPAHLTIESAPDHDLKRTVTGLTLRDTLAYAKTAK